MFMAVSWGACIPQRGCLQTERQGLCWQWLCGFENAPQPRRQWVSCKSGGVLLLETPAVSQRRSERGSSYLAGWPWPNLDPAVSCRGDHGSGIPPPAGLWAEPTCSMALQDCRKSPVKTPFADPSSLSWVLTLEMPQLPLPIAWSSDYQRSLQFCFF